MARNAIALWLLIAAACPAVAGGAFAWCNGRLTLLSPPPFADGEIHLWLADWRQVALPASTALSPDEQSRLGKILVKAKADELQHSHTLLRQLLSAYTGLAPAEVPITVGNDNKPRLSDPEQPLRFNLSHSGNHVLIGTLSDRQWPGAAIGVDIERIDPNVDWRARAPFVLAPVERRYLESLPADRAAHEFYRIWVIKEAVLKANGRNAVMRPTAVAAVDESGNLRLDGAWDRRHYQVQTTETPDGYWMAVAIAADREIRVPKIKLTRLP